MIDFKIAANIKAGIVVFLVALPLCLGIAMACDVPLFSGIISGFIGGVLVTCFSNSTYSVSGPAAGLTAIVLVSISELGTFELFLASLVFAGLLQTVFGIIKAGRVANFIPSSVIKGMLASIGILLIIKQVPFFVGYDAATVTALSSKTRIPEHNFSYLVNATHYITPAALVIGLISFLILLIGNCSFYKNSKVLNAFPIPLLVVLVGIIFTLIISHHPILKFKPSQLISIPYINNWATFVSNLTFPNFNAMRLTNFWIISLTIAAVASLETLLNIEAVDKISPNNSVTNSNKELIAQGIGNTVCGLVGGLPITSVIVRSSANINAGATSKLSTIFHAFFLASAVILIPTVLSLIPNACLAAILIYTGYKLTTITLYKSTWALGFDQFLPFITTIIVMLFTDLLKGVTAGLLITLILILKDYITSVFDVTTSIINGQTHYIVLLPKYISFFNQQKLAKILSQINNNTQITIDGSANKKNNTNSKKIILQFITLAENKNTEIKKINLNL